MAREDCTSMHTQDEKVNRGYLIDMLHKRINMLEGQDRVLLTMYLRNGNSLRQLAMITGTNESTMGRRIARLMKRLIDENYAACMRNYRNFSQFERQLAREYFICGMSVRDIAARHATTYYRAYQTLKRIRIRLNKIRSANVEIRN